MAPSDEGTWIWRRFGKTDEEVTREVLSARLTGLQFICDRSDFCSVACLDLHLPTAELSVVVWESIQPASFGGNQARASRPIGLVEREERRLERALFDTLSYWLFFYFIGRQGKGRFHASEFGS